MNEKKRLLGVIGIIFLLLVLFYILFILPAKKRFVSARTEVGNKTRLLYNFYTRPEGPPSKNDIAFLSSEIKLLDEKNRGIEKMFLRELNLNKEISPVEFGTLLYETKKRLLQEAKDADAEIPPDIGFKETLPQPEESLMLVKQLDAVSLIIRKGISLENFNLRGIKYLGVKEEGLWEKVGMELELYGMYEDIVNFMYCISRAERVCVIKSIAIKKIGEGITKPVKSKGEQPFTKKTGEEAIPASQVSANISLELYNYIARHGN